MTDLVFPVPHGVGTYRRARELDNLSYISHLEQNWASKPVHLNPKVTPVTTSPFSLLQLCFPDTF